MPNNSPSTPLEGEIVDIIQSAGGDAKHWYQSKTIAFNALAVLLAVAMLLGFGDHPTPEVADQVTSALVAVVGAVNIVLRLVTSRSVG